MRCRTLAAHTAKPPVTAGRLKTSGFALSPYDAGLGRTLSGGVEPERKAHERPGPTTEAYARAGFPRSRALEGVGRIVGRGVILPPIGYVVLTAGPSVRRAIFFAANSLTMAAAAYSLPLGNWRWPDSRFPEIEPRC